ncbi:4-methylaminobutanoate oxidase (formaldehyde-forming) [Sulfitobacter sp. THAF37]|uniref:NAD(P)/FAD-dependent oxidoreductase n=1 Tax=Sulfitobacter sp. THAF37 TaxID=2587855 RepID=UPI001268CCD1|nr:FAD-binding oxidoreductase [Sulfitobacter sp. THAF37]QFT59067.1 4-methylaminobutanoate oxidase (formaldehyde-forming) [Sulfitobacter sp. THAF37]
MTATAEGTYDVVIIGGAMHGSALAWWLTRLSGFDGRVLVVERDPTYEFASTSHTHSCIRQQFSNETNIRVSQFGAEFIKNFRDFMGGDPEVPALALQSFGYLYLADNDAFALALQQAQQIQVATGAQTRHMTRDEIAALYPFYNLDDIIAGNHNTVDEGYFDGGTMFDWFKRMARRAGVHYIHDEVTAITLNGAGTAIESVTLRSGDAVPCGMVVNASGPRARATAQMAGLDLPVAPRKRFSFLFEAAEPLTQDLPLTIDPSGVHMHSEGKYYLAGCAPDDDPDVAYDDFGFDHSLWENKVWPAIATRVPAFERVKVINEWVGHYAYNTFDQNAIVGPHPVVSNFVFVNGFSGHGLQQAPAIGRGVAEWITHGEYRTIDLAPFAFSRIAEERSFLEKAII